MFIQRVQNVLCRFVVQFKFLVQGYVVQNRIKRVSAFFNAKSHVEGSVYLQTPRSGNAAPPYPLCNLDNFAYVDGVLGITQYPCPAIIHVYCLSRKTR